jgi:maltooligosyltrehalose trehalohydrolase
VTVPSSTPVRPRRLSAGIELQDDGTASVRVWAPRCTRVDVVLERERADAVALDREADGFFSAVLRNVAAGDRYWFRLDAKALRPDPVSRYQPDGPHGPSVIVDPRAFRWTDAGWPGVVPAGQVFYEMHVGTFTPEGTWSAAAEQLAALAHLGVTIIEMMPVADFPGRFGWGYDGVNLYAPTRLYGTPDDLRAFVNHAHALGLGVILDVVYNHLGPDGNYLTEYSPDYFTDRYKNDWGQAINFEGPRPARDFFIENGGYWIDEFHFDGLRLDATQDIHDSSDEHVIKAIASRARSCSGNRRVYIVAENESQDTVLIRPASEGGYGVDAAWNDDYHHNALVSLTGRREAYYTDYTGTPQEILSSIKYGYLYQGQWYSWQQKRRGTSTRGLSPTSFVHFLENHDQVANSAFGRRVHELTSPGRYRTMTALTLLGPATPLLFQGQEFASSAPFLFFADHGPDLAEAIGTGRREFLEQFPSITDPGVRQALAPPGAIETFRRCTLDFGERERHAEAYALHRDLLRLRRSDPVIARGAEALVDGAVLGPDLFLVRLEVADDCRLMIVNLGTSADLGSVAEPLLAAPVGCRWEVSWSSEAVRYGGDGQAPFDGSAESHVPAEALLLLRPVVVEPRTTQAEHDG